MTRFTTVLADASTSTSHEVERGSQATVITNTKTKVAVIFYHDENDRVDGAHRADIDLRVANAMTITQAAAALKVGPS